MTSGKNKKQDTFMGFIRGNLFQITALLVAIFNIWLASKLAPLATNIALNDQRINEIERIDPIGSKHWQDVIDRLNRIEGKIDTHISLH